MLFRLEERQKATEKNFEDIFFPGERLNFPENHFRVVFLVLGHKHSCP